MNRAEILDRVQNIFRDIFDDNDILITDETNATDIEDWESLEQINILVAIQKEFSIKFSIDDVEGLENVGQTIDLIEAKLS
ncbi:MAG: acyl carrier protein [Oscillospiraceae bacterium]|nr:acyl carrier protein [Oscillospiraceae bacterium]